MTRRRWLAVGLVVAAVLWSRIDAAFEGPVLIRFDSRHGLVTADLVGVAFLGVAVWLWFIGSHR